MKELILKNTLIDSARILLPLCVPLIVMYIVSAMISKETSDAYVVTNKICRIVISCWWAFLGMLVLYLFNPILGGNSFAYSSGMFTSFFIISIVVVLVCVRKIFQDNKKYNEPIYQLIRNFSGIVIGICVVLFIPIISQLLVLLTPIFLPIFALNVIGDRKIFGNIVFGVIRFLIWIIILAEIVILILILAKKVPIEYQPMTNKIVRDFTNLFNSMFFKK